MSMGYLYIFLSVLFISGTNIFDKILSGKSDRRKTVMMRYFASVITILICILLMGEFPEFSKVSLVLMGLGVVNYLVLLSLYHGIQHTHTGLFFLVSYLYIPILYGVNILLFGQSEILSPLKLSFGIGFMSIVGYLIYFTGSRTKIVTLSSYFFAFLCALGWAFTFGVSTFIVKNDIISPIHIFFYEALGSLLMATIVYLNKTPHITLSSFLPERGPMIGGSLLAIGILFLFLAYSELPANIVNVLSLSDLLFTTLLGYIFLHERLEKKTQFLLLSSFLFLIIFSTI